MILPDYYGSTYQKRLMTFYAEIYKARFGEYPKVKYDPVFYVLLKRAFDKYGEIKLAAAILVHFEQRGEKIQEQGFPLGWVFKNIEPYLAFLEQEKEINTDSDEALYEAITKRLKYLNVNFNMDLTK